LVMVFSWIWHWWRLSDSVLSDMRLNRHAS
jgi:hypothetical protein